MRKPLLLLFVLLACNHPKSIQTVEGYPTIQCEKPSYSEKLSSVPSQCEGREGKHYRAIIICGEKSIEISAIYWACGDPEAIEVRIANRRWQVEKTEIDSTGSGGLSIVGISGDSLYYFQSGYSGLWALITDDLRNHKKSFKWKTGRIE